MESVARFGGFQHTSDGALQAKILKSAAAESEMQRQWREDQWSVGAIGVRF